MIARILAAPAVAILALAGAQEASAATIATTRPCLNSESPAQFTGAGFTPGAVVNVAGLAFSAQGIAGPDGSVAIPFTSPLHTSPSNNVVPPAAFTFTASDGTNTAMGSALVAVPGAVLPQVGRTRVQMRIQLTGFEPGQVLYAHVRWSGKWRRTVRLGTAVGPCGTLEAKRKLLRKTSGSNYRPVYVQFDRTIKPATDTHQTAYWRFLVTKGIAGHPEIYRRVANGWRERTGI